MISVLLVDDEIHVCELLRAMINWEALGFSVMGTAHDGNEALDIIKSGQPDLVITDIRMPGYDGLELVALVKQNNEQTEFIIISGYSEFEYAQTAMKYGVGDYLLKPIQEEQLTEALQRIKARYEQRITTVRKQNILLAQNRTDVQRLRSTFVQLAARRPQELEQMTVNDIRSAYHLEFHQGVCRSLIIKLNYSDKAYRGSLLEIVAMKIIQQLRKRINAYCLEMEFCWIEPYVFAICQMEPCCEDSFHAALIDMLDKPEIKYGFYPNISLSIAVGKPVSSLTLLGKSFLYAWDALWERLKAGVNQLHDKVPPETENTALLDAFRREIQRSWNTGNIEMTIKAINELEKACDPLCGRDIYNVVSKAGEYILTKAGAESDRLAQMQNQCEAGDTAGALFDALRQTARREIAEMTDQDLQCSIRPVREAQQWIQNHCSEPITLEQVANHIGFNPKYFSVLFKKASGKGFMEYLCDVRIEEAKKLLTSTNLLVSEICSSVGYTDIKHFTKTFKKKTELKPTDYRKLYG